jgi:alpha-L-fucosidase
VKSVERLMEIYMRSVGRNSKLLLNVPPTPAGLLHEADVSRLQAFGDTLRRAFEEDVAAAGAISWGRSDADAVTAELALDRVRRISALRLEEPIGGGQMVARYVVSGSNGAEWQVLSSGTTIGYARIDRFSPIDVRRVRLEIQEAVGRAGPIAIKLYA